MLLNRAVIKQVRHRDPVVHRRPVESIVSRIQTLHTPYRTRHPGIPHALCATAMINAMKGKSAAPLILIQ